MFKTMPHEGEANSNESAGFSDDNVYRKCVQYSASVQTSTLFHSENTQDLILALLFTASV